MIKHIHSRFVVEYRTRTEWERIERERKKMRKRKMESMCAYGKWNVIKSLNFLSHFSPVCSHPFRFQFWVRFFHPRCCYCCCCPIHLFLDVVFIRLKWQLQYDRRGCLVIYALHCCLCRADNPHIINGIWLQTVRFDTIFFFNFIFGYMINLGWFFFVCGDMIFFLPMILGLSVCERF